MTTTEEQSTASAMNDVFRIRDIIFGEQMSEYENRFKAVDAQLQALQAQMEALDVAAQERLQQTTADIQRQIADLQASLTAKLEALDLKATARADLGDMLIEFGERLKEG